MKNFFPLLKKKVTQILPSVCVFEKETKNKLYRKHSTVCCCVAPLLSLLQVVVVQLLYCCRVIQFSLYLRR